MTALTQAEAPDAVWQGRADTGERGDTRRLFNIVQPLAVAASDDLAGATVLVGFACDAGVRLNQGRVGAADGPRAIRRALASLPVHDVAALYDAGDVRC